MAKSRRRIDVRLNVECLEGREVPSGSPWLVEQFDQTAPGSLPDGWSFHSSDGSSGFAATQTHALGSTTALQTNGNSNSITRAWSNIALPADAQVSANVYMDSLVPGQVISRGQNLDTDTPTYYSVAVTRGMRVQLLKVVNGESTVLGNVTSASWLSNKWVRVTLTTIGNDLYVQIFRTDTAQYLGADGRWQFAPTQTMHVQDSDISAGGYAGLARSAQYAGVVHFDNFATAPPSTDLMRESLIEEKFSRPLPGGLPAGWMQWSENGSAFRVSTQRTLTDSAALRTAAPNRGAVRTWFNSALPADIDVSGTVYLSGDAPAQIIARGSNLDGDTPTYYAIQATAGMQVQLLRVVNGQSSVIGSLQSNEPLSDQWVKFTLSLTGNELRVSVYRTDTAQYLDANGDWQVMPVWAMDVQDSAISGGGLVGVGRDGSAAGSVTFDSLVVTKNTAPADSTGGSFNFDTNSTGSLPDGWAQWNSNETGGFQVSNQQASSSPNSLMSDGGSDLESRTWLNNFQAADAQIGADVYLNSLVPSQLILRGQNLDGDSPSYYAASVTRGLDVQLIRVTNGQATVLSDVSSATWDTNIWVRLNFAVQGNTLQLQVIRLDNGKYLDQDGNWQSDPAIAASVNDTALPDAGSAGLVRPAIYSGQIVIDNVNIQSLASQSPSDVPPVETPPTDQPTGDGTTPPPAPEDNAPPPTTNTPDTPTPTPTPPPTDSGSSGGTTTTPTPPPTTPSSLPAVPQHLSHIRIAQFAYYGTTIGAFERSLLQKDVDVVIPNTNLVGTISAASPQTPQFIYTNASNIYRELLTDWLNYADAHGLSREAAFYHVTQATPFTGDSASSWPVDWFWSVALGSDGNWADKTSASRDASQPMAWGSAGQSLMIGNTDMFREINIDLASGAAGGWRGVLEYATATDSAGNPTAWRTLNTISDGTNGFTKSGRITFDPPADWATNKLGDGPQLYYVRIRTVTDGVAPVSRNILGRDYVNANGRAMGVIPAFDKSADANGDGYLSDAEYANRRPGMDARFVYESRAFYPAYGQNRFAANVANPAYQQWAADYSYRFLQANPGSAGLFVDNSLSKIAFDPTTIAESLDNYADNYAQLLAIINAKIAPKWVLANVAGGGTAVDALANRGISYLEEFAIRPLSASYSQFEDVSSNLHRRLSLSKGKSYAILDSLATNGSMTDARVQIATLAYYYLLADPQQTMLMFNGGNAPNTPWAEHWTKAAEFNVGQPLGDWTMLAKGKDPANSSMTYKVYERRYQNALVLYKPLSYNLGKAGTTADNTATTHVLDAKYRPLLADGTLGAPINKITLRNGEGAILVKV